MLAGHRADFGPQALRAGADPAAKNPYRPWTFEGLTMRNVAVCDEVESLVARVADEFREHQKRGERPNAEEYAARYPEAADVLRRVLGALEVVGLAAATGAEASAVAEVPLAGTLGDYRI